MEYDSYQQQKSQLNASLEDCDQHYFKSIQTKKEWETQSHSMYLINKTFESDFYDSENGRDALLLVDDLEKQSLCVSDAMDTLVYQLKKERQTLESEIEQLDRTYHQELEAIKHDN